MSWTRYFNGVRRGDELADALVAASPQGSVHDEVDVAVNAAILAAIKLLDAVQPDQNGLVNITLVGHANPNNEPQLGWSNDFITITVSQVPEPAVPDEPVKVVREFQSNDYYNNECR